LDKINRNSSNPELPHVNAVRVKKLGDKEIARVYVKAKDTGVLSGVGWVVNDDIQQCMLCSHSFSFFTRRHHCRACGLLVCYLCSGNQSLIVGAESLGQQRICNDCCSKEAAAIAVPVDVLPTLDWGRPWGDEEDKVNVAITHPAAVTPSVAEEPKVDAEGEEMGSTQIQSVDLRTLSATEASHAAQKTPHKTPKKESTEAHAPDTHNSSTNSISNTDTSSVPEPCVTLNGFEDKKVVVTLPMMVFEQDQLIPRLQVRELKEHAVNHPKMLLGWQITADVNVKPESIYIIVDIRKNSAFKTEFKLIQVNNDLKIKEMWTLLKRNKDKPGIDFVPMRKVIYLGEEDLTKGINLSIKKRKSIMF